MKISKYKQKLIDEKKEKAVNLYITGLKKEKAVNLYITGLTLREVGRALNMSRTWVWQVIKEKDLTKKDKGI